MNYIDFIIILAVVIGAVVGSMKGLIRQLGSVGGLLIGIILSRVFGGLLSSIFQSVFDMPTQVSDILSHSLIFIAVYIACVQVAKLIRRLANAVAMGWIDRIAGVVFGGIQYLFGLSLLFNLILVVDPSCELLTKEAMVKSKYYESTLNFAPKAFAIAQERLDLENKEISQLFIPCESEWYCENCKAN